MIVGYLPTVTRRDYWHCCYCGVRLWVPIPGSSEWRINDDGLHWLTITTPCHECLSIEAVVAAWYDGLQVHLPPVIEDVA